MPLSPSAVGRLRHRAAGRDPPRPSIPGHAASGRRQPAEGDEASEETRSQLDTSYVCVIDRHGNVFSATPSDTWTKSPVPIRAPASFRRCAGPNHGPKLTTRLLSHRASAAPDTQRFCALGRRGKFGRELIPFGTPGGDVPDPGNAADLPQHGRVRHEPAAGGRGATLRHSELPELVPKPHAYQDPAHAEIARCRRLSANYIHGPRHDVVWWPQFIWRAGGVPAVARIPIPA